MVCTTTESLTDGFGAYATLQLKAGPAIVTCMTMPSDVLSMLIPLPPPQATTSAPSAPETKSRRGYLFEHPSATGAAVVPVPSSVPVPSPPVEISPDPPVTPELPHAE